jgi:hypothetical protein
METWKKIIEFPAFEVSDYGRVRNSKGKILEGTEFNGYRRVSFRINGKLNSRLVHRSVAIAFIENLEGKEFVDHIDGNRSNNHISNLRWATVSENNANATKRVNSTSKHKGVYWNKNRQLWESKITANKKNIVIGWYNDEDEAGRAYDLKALELFGQFAKLNYPLENYI